MTDLSDTLSLSAVQNQQEWLDKHVPTRSSHAMDASQAIVATPEVASKGRSLEVEPGDSERQHRHRHRSRSTARTPGSGSEPQTRSSNSEHPRRRRIKSEGNKSVSVSGRGVTFGSASSEPLRRNQTDEARPALLIEDRQVVLVRVQLAERNVAAVDDAAIANELEAQGGHVGRTVNRLSARHQTTASLAAAVPRLSEQTAAGVAARVAQKAAVIGGGQLKRRDAAALRSYTKAFMVENGRCVTSTKSLPPH